MSKNQRLALFVKDKDVINQIKKIISLSKLSIEIFILNKIDDIDTIDKKNIDYVLVDQDIEGENFQAVLLGINQLYPHVVRILIAEKWSQELVIMSNLMVHLIIEKTVLQDDLKSILHRAQSMSNLLKEKELVKMVNSFDNLPSIKTNYLEILHLLKSSDSSLKKIGELIENDIVLSAKVLQISNMSTYARASKVASVKQSVVYLGVNIIRALIIHIQVFTFKSSNPLVYMYLNVLEKHSMLVAEYSKLFAEGLNMSRSFQDDCFTAGLLHDIGKFVLINKMHRWDEINTLAENNNMHVYQAEENELKITHAEIGAYLLGIWGFSAEVIDAVVYHHKPSKQEEKKISVATFVHVAEAMINKDIINNREVFINNLDIDYIENLYIKNQILAVYDKITNVEKGE